MAYLDWHVGMNVVCINASGWFCANHPAPPGIARPIEGNVYAVTHLDWDEDEDILFVGLSGYSEDHGFDARAFRPVQTRKADISVFTAMLHDERQKVPS